MEYRDQNVNIFLRNLVFKYFRLLQFFHQRNFRLNFGFSFGNFLGLSLENTKGLNDSYFLFTCGILTLIFTAFSVFWFFKWFFSALNVHFGLVCLFCQRKFFNFVRIFPDMFSISSKKNLLGFNLDNGFLYVLHQILCYIYRLVSFIAHSAQNNFKLRLLNKQK